MAKNRSFVEKELLSAIDTFNGRDSTYGSSYIIKGKVMQLLFPNGLDLKTEHDFGRFALLNFITSKLIRYSHSFKTGHYDSMHDISNYAAMLNHLTQLDLEQDEERKDS